MIKSRGIDLIAAVFVALVLNGCGGGGGGEQPPQPRPTATLSASPGSVPDGGSSTLTWSSTNASSCTASGGTFTGAKASSGSESVGPITATTSYTITCGSATSSATVTVTPAPTVTLSASLTSVPPGGLSTLTWSSTNATSCTASGGWSGARDTSGTENVGPITAETTYTLTCGTGGVTDSKSVVVTPLGNTGEVDGRLLIGPSTQTDSDTNDTVRTAIRNDTLDTAQFLPNPVIVGGFATQANSGPEGPLKAGGDVDDLYRVSLTANQVIELSIAVPEEADLDLGLYTPTGTLVDASTSTGANERLVVAAAGDYVVRVLAFSGTSNYVLTIGQATSSNSANLGFTLSTDFVPGEILARFIEPAQARKNSAVGLSHKTQMAANHQLTLVETAPGQHSLLKLNKDRASVASKLSNHEFTFANERDRTKYETLYAIKALARDPQVKWAEPNYILHSNAIPDDPRYPDQRWHYELIRAPEAWNIATGNGDVIVAVLDSGVVGHPDLQPRFVPGFDFVSDPVNADDGDGRDSNPTDPGKPPAQGDKYTFHGTHVAGTIGAMGNDATGATGINWNVRIMPLRGLGVIIGNSNDLLVGMLGAARLPNAANFVPAQRADVINMSFGAKSSPQCPQALQDVIDQVRAAGVVLVASAGNDGSAASAPPPDFPSSCNGVISVTAVNRFDQRSYYSNAGASADVAAPGGDPSGYIFSTHAIRQGSMYFASYESMQGTSMAAPHVAGVIALMKSVDPSLTPAQIDDLLAAGLLTDDIGPAGPDDLGVGRINAFKAVTAAQTGTIPTRPGQLSVAPTTVNLGDASTSALVTVANTGTAAVSVTQVVSSVPWLSAAPEQVDASGLGTYRLTVNRTSLASDVYIGNVEFLGSAGTAVRVTVQMQVTTTPVVPDAGQHYVLLIDPTTFDTVYQAEVDARGSSVHFAFADVAAGSYLLAAGTDSDNDGFICDEGEACGEYPVFGEGATIDTSAGAIGLDFATAYSDTIRVAGASTSTPSTSRSGQGFRRLR